MNNLKYIIGFFLICVLGYFAQINVPYWWIGIVVAAVIGVVLGERSWGSFCMGFIGLFLLWAGYAHYLDLYNQGFLAKQMGQLFGGVNNIVLALLTGVLGGLLGGLGAMTGSLGRRIWKRPKNA